MDLSYKGITNICIVGTPQKLRWDAVQVESRCQLQYECFDAMQTCHFWMEQEGMDISQRDFSMACLMACTAPQRFRRRLCPRLHTLCAPLQLFDITFHCL